MLLGDMKAGLKTLIESCLVGTGAVVEWRDTPNVYTPPTSRGSVSLFLGQFQTKGTLDELRRSFDPVSGTLKETVVGQRLFTLTLTGYCLEQGKGGAPDYLEQIRTRLRLTKSLLALSALNVSLVRIEQTQDLSRLVDQRQASVTSLDVRLSTVSEAVDAIDDWIESADVQGTISGGEEEDMREAVITRWRIVAGLMPVPVGAHDVSTLTGVPETLTHNPVQVESSLSAKVAQINAPTLPGGHRLIGCNVKINTVGVFSADAGQWNLLVQAIDSDTGALLSSAYMGDVGGTAGDPFFGTPPQPGINGGPFPVGFLASAGPVGFDGSVFFGTPVTTPILMLYAVSADSSPPPDFSTITALDVTLEIYTFPMVVIEV